MTKAKAEKMLNLFLETGDQPEEGSVTIRIFTGERGLRVITGSGHRENFRGQSLLDAIKVRLQRGKLVPAKTGPDRGNT